MNVKVHSLTWPEGWTVQMFHHALLAVRQHRVPDFSADVETPPDLIRQVVGEIDEMSAACGFYVFDTHTHPDTWVPAPDVPRAALESIDKIYVRDYQNPERILKLDDAGQGKELLLTRACRDCGDVIVITIGWAARAVRKHNLQGGRYTPPLRCRTCKDKKRSDNGLRASVGSQLRSKKKKKKKKADQPAEAAAPPAPSPQLPEAPTMGIEPIDP